MNYLPTPQQIAEYQTNGFLLIEDFLSPEELEHWRDAVMTAVKERGGKKIPGKDIVTGQDDGINEDADYYGKVFDQLLNLWQTSAPVKKLMTDERMGKIAATLAGVEGIRIWHDQALFKRPWANPTAWHLDTPSGLFPTERPYPYGSPLTMPLLKMAACILSQVHSVRQILIKSASERIWTAFLRSIHNSPNLLL